MRLRLLMTSLLVAGLSTLPAHGVMYDFAAYVDGTVETAYHFGQTLPAGGAGGLPSPVDVYAWHLDDDDGGGGVSPGTLGALPTTALATIGDTTAGPADFTDLTNAYAYGDSGAAGFGVASKITAGKQASPGSDDNISEHRTPASYGNFTEILGVRLPGGLSITKLFFKDANHKKVFPDAPDDDVDPALDPRVHVTFDGGSSWTLYDIDIASDATYGVLDFGNPGKAAGLIGVSYNNSHLYLSALDAVQTTTVIPEANAVVSWVLMGLSGTALVFVRRRKARGE